MLTTMVRWSALGPDAQASLRAELSTLLRRVFADLDATTEEGFLGRLEEVALYRVDGALVGFNSLRLVPVALPGGRRTTAMVHLAALLPEHRGGNRSLLHVAWVGWRHWIRSGFRSFYYCCRMIHPSPFRLFVRYPDRSYPSPLRPHDADAQAVLDALAPQLGYTTERNPAGYLVTPPRFRVATEAERASTYRASDPITAWFTEQVPDWPRGQGLLVVTPLDLWTALFVTPRVVFRRPRAV